MIDNLLRGQKRTAEGWVEEYEGRGAYFEHDGNARRPHPLLRSRKHSKGFFNSRPLIADEKLMRDVATDIVTNLIATEGFMVKAVQRVVGPKTGATKLAEFVAAEIGSRCGYPCGWASPKKVLDDKGNTIAMEIDDPDHPILPGENVLFVEDVVTTGGSIEHVVNLVKKCGAKPLMFVGMMVNRSGEMVIRGLRLVALVTRHLPNYDVPRGELCPLCAARSHPIEPKDNWSLLTANYERKE